MKILNSYPKKKYIIKIEADDYPQEIIEWCNVTIGSRRTTCNMEPDRQNLRKFIFDNEQDAMLFTLKWL